MRRWWNNVGFALVSIAFLIAALTSFGCASRGPSTSTPAVAAATPTPQPAATPEPFLGPQPPDGKWLVDDKGRQYFRYEIPKHEGYYDRLPDNQIRIDYGMVLDVLEERPTSFVVKIYRSDQGPSAPPPTRIDATRREEVAASYKVTIPTSDRLTLRRFDRGLPATGQWRQGFVLVDFDGDGQRDIVFGPPRKGVPAPRVFLGDGKGDWRETGLNAGRDLDYGDVAVADFNGDGHLDLALAVHLRGVKVVVADGKGGFQDWSKGLDYQVAGGGGAPPEITSRTLVPVDWNRDGKIDILILGEGPRMGLSGRDGAPGFSHGAQGPILFLNRGDGSWERRDQGTGKDRVFGDVLRLVDLDRDGRLDFVTGSAIEGYRKILHYGNEDGGWREEPMPTLRPGFVGGVAVADFDRDGRPDLAIGYVANEADGQHAGVDVHFQTEDGWKRVPLHAEAGQNGATAAAAGDLDGDGAADLVTLGADGRREVYLGDGRGGFTAESAPELNARTNGCRGYYVELSDLDGDGRDEVVMAFAGEPGSEALLGAQPVCPTRGSLEAWKAESAVAAR